ncbi:MAG TPA: hypothetical protein VJM77_06185 [Nitrospiria bacterium]|nr:hypothetical protein [Nitrospiria bacterium]
MKQSVFFIDQGKRWNSFKAVFRALFLTGLFLIMTGCGEESGQCGGVRDSGLCITIDTISPNDTAAGGGETSDVDALQVDCDSTAAVDPEPFGAHAADVKFSVNKTSPTVAVPPAPAFVTLTQYTISYALNPGSPSGPALTSRTFNDTIKIKTGASVTATLRFVEIAQKDQYLSGGGSVLTPSSYTATYTFTGTDELNNPITLSGGTQFTIGDFDLCSS